MPKKQYVLLFRRKVRAKVETVSEGVSIKSAVR